MINNIIITLIFVVATIALIALVGYAVLNLLVGVM